MDKEDKKKVKKVFGISAKILYGVVCAAAAVGAAPFDRGTTMKNLGKCITGTAGGVMSEIDNWMNRDD